MAATSVGRIIDSVSTTTMHVAQALVAEASGIADDASEGFSVTTATSDSEPSSNLKLPFSTYKTNARSGGDIPVAIITPCQPPRNHDVSAPWDATT